MSQNNGMGNLFEIGEENLSSKNILLEKPIDIL